MAKRKPFTFEISLSVLNHLGRSLYRSFATVLGEAVSNSWDADAKNVYIYINRNKNSLRKDDDYMKAAASFVTAPGKEPPFEREESWLLQAFENMPKITLPPGAPGGSRVFELRTYESPSLQDHWRKIEQMNSGESAIFTKAGIPQVFFGDVLIGSRQPCLMYLLCYNNLGERDPKWAAFVSSPEWKALSTDPKYAYEDIVTNITNVMLTSADYSQI